MTKRTAKHIERIRKVMRTRPLHGWQTVMAEQLGVTRQRVGQLVAKIHKEDPSLPTWTSKPQPEKKPRRLFAGDLTGKVFERWTVLSRAVNHGLQTSWNCRCECGTESVVVGCYLRNGLSKSCGCYRRDRMLMLWRKA